MSMGDFTLESNSFENNGVIPKNFGYKHGNISPPLNITNVPDETRSLALVMDDPDAMHAVGKVWVHWIVCNIDPNADFAENEIPPGCIEGKTDFGEIGYGGPAPPDKEHTYVFKLYALDAKLDVQPGITKQQLEESMKSHIIDNTELRGRYSPQSS